VFEAKLWSPSPSSSPLLLESLRVVSPIKQHAEDILREATAESGSTTSDSPKAPSRPASTEPYFVGRTKSNNLPVYKLAKRGGNLQQTKIQKVEGDTSILRTQLQSALGLSEKEVVVNPVTSHIIIKVGSSLYQKHPLLIHFRQGWRQEDVLEFLRKRNF
jgi:large subunit ribosomal protein L49